MPAIWVNSLAGPNLDWLLNFCHRSMRVLVIQVLATSDDLLEPRVVNRLLYDFDFIGNSRQFGHAH